MLPPLAGEGKRFFAVPMRRVDGSARSRVTGFMVDPNASNKPAPSSTEAPPDPWHYVRVVWHRLYIVLFLMILGLVVGALQLRRTPPTYTATAVLKYEPRGQQLVDLGERSSLLYQRDEIATAVQLVRSPAVAELVLRSQAESAAPAASAPREKTFIDSIYSAWIDASRSVRARLIPAAQPNLDPEVTRHEDRIKGVLSGLQVVHRPNTKLIEVRYTAGDPTRSARLANAFCEEFIRNLDGERRQLLTSARTFIDKQIKEAKERLDQAEREVFDFSGQADLRVLDKNLEIMTGTMSDLNSEVEKLRIEIEILEAESAATSVDNVRSVLLQEDQFYTQLRQRQTELLIQRSTLAAENQQEFPALLKLDREIASLETQFRAMEEKAAEQVAARLELARLKQSRLTALLDAQKKAVSDLQERMITYRILTRQVEASQTIFATLLDQYKRLEVVGDAAQANVVIVSRASIPRVPSAPSVSRVLAGWLGLGAALGLGLAIVLNMADRTVRNVAVVEEKLGLPTLGIIPSLVRKGAKANRVALLGPESNEGQREALQYMRTSILHSVPSQPPKVILVTSSLPQEGKSTISANLAITSALSGRTILVDVDLKRPTQHRIFGGLRQPGVADLLAGQIGLDEAIRPSGVDQLDLIPAGIIVPSPINLLDSRAMAELVAALRGRYDTVILDSAPSFGMADSLVLARHADGVCLVVRQGRTAYDVLGKVAMRYRAIGATILGVIHNQPSSRKVDGYGYSSLYKAREASRDNVATPG